MIPGLNVGAKDLGTLPELVVDVNIDAKKKWGSYLGIGTGWWVVGGVLLFWAYTKDKRIGAYT